MKKLKDNIIQSLQNKKINVFVLFFLAAFIILIFAKLSKEYTKTIPFDVKKVNVPPEYVILKDSVKINLTLKTYGFQWLKYYVSNPTITIDFSKDVQNINNTFLWDKSKDYIQDTQFNKPTKVLNIYPKVLTFKYGVNLIKKVPVKPMVNIEYGLGFDQYSEVISIPDSITVIGPDVLVSKIEYLETEVLVLKEIRTNVLETVNLKLPNQTDGVKFSKKQVTLQSKTDKFTEGTLKVPVNIINVPDAISIKYFPKMVNVSYYVSLSDYNSISVNDFKIICDFKKVSDDQSFLIPELKEFPRLVKRLKLGQQRIEFILTK